MQCSRMYERSAILSVFGHVGCCAVYRVIWYLFQ
jgi:hypothetical protein